MIAPQNTWNQCKLHGMFTRHELETILGVLREICGGAKPWDEATTQILLGISRDEVKRVRDKARSILNELETSPDTD